MSQFNSSLRRASVLGVAGTLVILSAYAGQAQEATPAQPAQADAGCSGLLCVFSASRPAPVAPAPQPAAANEDTISPPAAAAAEPVKPKP
jgi:hypothetical protein